MSYKKQIFKLSILKKFINDANSCVSLVPTTRLLALPPFSLNDMKSGIFYLLNSLLKKYDRSLDGIIIGYQNVKILLDENTGIIPIGSAETEVNISVEFYIFQPKIGSTLEGVINKKSNTHIGCLVHQYFNATILKPEDVQYEDWNCKDFEVNDKILFTVKDLDFTGLLPHIEGTINKENFLGCDRTKRKEGCDADVDLDIESKILSKSLPDNSSNFKKCKKGQNEQEDTILSSTVDSLLEKFVNEESSKKKKKKKKSKEKSDKDEKLQVESLISNAKELISIDINNKSKSNDGDNQEEKTKKKKKKKKEKDNDKESVLESSKKEEEPRTIADFFLQKLLSANDDDNDFVKPIKSKKEKKKKEKEPQSSLNNVSQSQPKPAELFYSTQLEPNVETQINSSCSPIPKRTSIAFDDKPTISPILKVEKKKEKKRNSTQTLKKDKVQVNGSGGPMDKFLQVGGLKNELEITEKKETPTEETTSLYEKLLKEAKIEMTPQTSKDTESDSSSKRKKKKKKDHGDRKLKNGSMYDVEFTPEKRNADKSLFSDSEQSHQSPAKKKNVNGVAKASVGTMLDLFFKEEGEKMKGDSKVEVSKTETKEKSPPKEKEESLYEKLLREARSMLELGEDSHSPPKKKRKTTKVPK